MLKQRRRQPPVLVEENGMKERERESKYIFFSESEVSFYYLHLYNEVVNNQIRDVKKKNFFRSTLIFISTIDKFLTRLYCISTNPEIV